MGSILIYIFLFIISYFYIIIIGGQTGTVFFYMILLSPFVSAFFTLIVRKKIIVTAKITKAEIENGGILKVLVHVENKSYLPVPFLDIVFCEEFRLELPYPSCVKVSLGPCKVFDFTAQYNAKSRGISEIGIKNINLRDYLGILKFSLPFDKEESTKKVTVVPKLIEIDAKESIIFSNSQYSEAGEKSDNENENISISGEPGFEFKEYVLGDPLHRIHYKLSAKLGKLMVRKNEASGISSKCLIIDPYLPIKEDKAKKTWLKKMLYNKETTDNKENQIDKRAVIEEKILEAVLLIANAAVKMNINTEIYLRNNENWLYYKIRDIDDIEGLRQSMALYEFSDNDNIIFERLPINTIMANEGTTFNERGKEVIVFTSMFDERLHEALNEGINNNITADIVYVKGFYALNELYDRQALKTENILNIDIKDDLKKVFLKGC